MKAVLIDNKEERAVASFEYDDGIKSCRLIEGIVKTIDYWDDDFSADESSVSGEEFFFADVYVKWNGSSGFRFYGEYHNIDIAEANKPKNCLAFYHLSGIEEYLKFMQTMVFIYEVMRYMVGDLWNEILADYEKLKNLNLLNGHSIRYYKDDELLNEDIF